MKVKVNGQIRFLTVNKVPTFWAWTLTLGSQIVRAVGIWALRRPL